MSAAVNTSINSLSQKKSNRNLGVILRKHVESFADRFPASFLHPFLASKDSKGKQQLFGVTPTHLQMTSISLLKDLKHAVVPFLIASFSTSRAKGKSMAITKPSSSSLKYTEANP